MILSKTRYTYIWYQRIRKYVLCPSISFFTTSTYCFNIFSPFFFHRQSTRTLHKYFLLKINNIIILIYYIFWKFNIRIITSQTLFSLVIKAKTILTRFQTDRVKPVTLFPRNYSTYPAIIIDNSIKSRKTILTFKILNIFAYFNFRTISIY